jgi:curved DNA-binding protein CbpA
MSRSHSFDPDINYYEILDVPYTATKSEITRSYRRLMRASHPDRFIDEAERRKAEERAKLLNAAYSVLSHPDVRRDYDSTVRARLINDALFQRYTGNAPGQRSANMPPQRPLSPEMVREQRRAQRSALTHFLLFIVLFVGALILILVIGSLVVELAHLASV